MKRLFAIAFLISLLAALGFAQSRPNRIWRPCAGTTERAKVEIESDGDINIVPCPTSDFLVNGAVTAVTGLSSLNGLVGATQTFGAPNAADTAAWSSAGTAHTLGLPITAVSGASRTNYVPYFNAANTLAKSSLKFQGGVFHFENALNTASFDLEIEPHATSASGRLWAGDYQSGNSVYLALDGGNAYLGGNGYTYLGDYAGTGNGSIVAINDAAPSIDITTNSSGAITIGQPDKLFLTFDGSSNIARFFNNDASPATVSFGTVASGIQILQFHRTLTTAGTTGNQTINRPSGTVNFAAGASSLTVTNSTINTSSIVFAISRTNDATCAVKNVVPGAGSFVINMTAACTAETSVGFFVTN